MHVSNAMLINCNHSTLSPSATCSHFSIYLSRALFLSLSLSLSHCLSLSLALPISCFLFPYMQLCICFYRCLAVCCLPSRLNNLQTSPIIRFRDSFDETNKGLTSDSDNERLGY